jgi:DNA polymerase I-like protein with 3'-5' exonuclease and polymerase domains
LGHKIDVVKTEYWDKGTDTDKIPEEVLSDYANQDVELTYLVYLKQKEQFEKQPKLYRLFLLACQDLLILEEMEWNGLLFDATLCEKRSEELSNKIEELDFKLRQVYPDLVINFNSGDQLSAFLYGGKITEEQRVADGWFKTGKRAGEIKYKRVEVVHTLPRLVEPLEGSELKKEGVFSTDEGTLRKLIGAKDLVSLILERSKLEKLLGTYYKGIPEINKKMNWEENMLHGQFNQCVAATGRLSSSKPNAQNFASDCQDILVSRFND